MAWSLTSGFSLDAFERKQSRSLHLAEYLAVYVQHLTPLHRTKTNELIEFLRDPDEGRIIIYFGLSYYGKACGFATLMLYPEADLGVIDHMAIAPTVRGYGAFFSFSELIAEYVERTTYHYNYVVAEIVLGDQPVTTGTTPSMLIRLTRFIGFRIANLPYYAPDPSIVSDKESCRAALMMYLQPDRSTIAGEELITLLHSIYFKHYGEWYRRIMSAEQYAEYRSALTKAFEQTTAFIHSQKIVKINGMKNFELPYIVEPGSKVSAALVGYILLVAFPATLTIALAVEQEARLTILTAMITLLVACLAFIPKIRGTLLRFLQLER
jgi:hypothetical protein